MRYYSAHKAYSVDQTNLRVLQCSSFILSVATSGHEQCSCCPVDSNARTPRAQSPARGRRQDRGDGKPVQARSHKPYDEHTARKHTLTLRM